MVYNGTIWSSYIISLFSVRIIITSRETDSEIWIMEGVVEWGVSLMCRLARGITNYELSGVTFTNIRNRSQEFIMESDSRVALFVGAKQSSAKFCFSNLCLLSCNDLADL